MALDNKKPTKPEFSFISVGGNDREKEKDENSKIELDDILSTHEKEIQSPTPVTKKKIVSAINPTEKLLLALTQLGPRNMDELTSLIRRFSAMRNEELLQTAEGIAYLSCKYGFSYNPDLTIEANRFIAKASMIPREKPRLTGEEKYLAKIKRYPHLQIAKKYKTVLDDLAKEANVPTTVITRLLLDTALAGIGIKIEK